MENDYYLFLDDVRMPHEVGNYIYPVELRKLYRLQDWVIVRSYAEFVNQIFLHGLPKVVSFDHDLADEHYRPSMFNPDKHYSQYYSDGTFKGKTGYHAAKWMIDYIVENRLLPPIVYCHSMNPVGKENIESLFRNFNTRARFFE